MTATPAAAGTGAVGMSSSLSDRHDEFTQLTEVRTRSTTLFTRRTEKTCPQSMRAGELAFSAMLHRLHALWSRHAASWDAGLNTEVRDNFAPVSGGTDLTHRRRTCCFRMPTPAAMFRASRPWRSHRHSPRSPCETQILHPAGRHHDSRSAKSDCRAAPSHRLIPCYRPRTAVGPDLRPRGTAITEARWFPADRASRPRPGQRPAGRSPASAAISASASTPGSHNSGIAALRRRRLKTRSPTTTGTPRRRRRHLRPVGDPADWRPLTLPASEIRVGDIISFEDRRLRRKASIGADGTIDGHVGDDDAPTLGHPPPPPRRR